MPELFPLLFRKLGIDRIRMICQGLLHPADIFIGIMGDPAELLLLPKLGQAELQQGQAPRLLPHIPNNQVNQASFKAHTK